MKITRQKLHNSLIRHLRKWHRKLGILAAFFLIFLSVSGIALNHTDSLKLAHHPIHNAWLLDHYGIAAPNDIRFYQNHQFTVTNHLLWFEDALLLESDEKLIALGKMRLSNTPVVMLATSHQIYLYNLAGELIDQLGSESGVPENIQALSLENNAVVVKTPQGIFQGDDDFFSWQQINPMTDPIWIQPESVLPVLQKQAEIAYRAHFLNLERIILDAHSGRIFGLVGVLLMDTVAVLLILLSLSGMYIWMRYARAKR